MLGRPSLEGRGLMNGFTVKRWGGFTQDENENNNHI
jgi:hypothetical protein